MTIIIIYIYFLLRFRFLFGYERFYIASHAQIYSARFAANQIVYNTFIFYYLFIRFVSGFAGSNRLLERAMQRNKKKRNTYNDFAYFWLFRFAISWGFL